MTDEHTTWDKVLKGAQVFALVATPVIVALFAFFAQSRETDVRLLELGTTLLLSPAADSSEAVREWARALVNTYSDVDLRADIATDLSRWREGILGTGIRSGSSPNLLYVDGQRIDSMNFDSIRTIYFRGVP